MAKLTQGDIAAKVANAFGIRIQDPRDGIIALNEDGSNPAVQEYAVPVRLDDNEEVVEIFYSPTEDATNFADGSPVRVVYNEQGELEFLKLSGARARRAYSGTTPNPNFVLQQHTHQNAAGGGQLNASLVFSSGKVPLDFGGTGANLSGATIGSLFKLGTGGFAELPIGANGNIVHASGGVFVSAALNLSTAQLSNTLPLARGGGNVDFTTFLTNALVAKGASALQPAALTNGAIMVGGTSGVPTFIAPGSNGNILVVSGGSWQSQAPSFAASVITSGQLALERGGTEADLGATGPGYIVQTSAGAVFSNAKANFSASAAPTVNDDSGDGYAPTSWWFDLTNGAAYWLKDASVGTAVWVATGGSSGPFTTTSGVVHLVTTTNNFNIGGTANLGKVAIVGDDDEAQLRIRAYGLQSVNIMSVEDSGGSAYLTIDSVGGVRVNVGQSSTAAFVALGDNDNALLATSPSNDRVGVGITSPDGRFEVRGRADQIQTIIRAHSTQTSNLLEWRNSSGTALSVVDGVGKAGFGETAPTALAHLGASTTSRAPLRITTGVAPSSPNDGDVWNDDAQNAMMMSLLGLTGAFGKVIFTQTATKTIANTGTETTIFTTGVGSLTLPANYLTAGKTLLIFAAGYFGTMGSSGGLDIRVKFGSTTLASGQQLVSSSDDNTGWCMFALITCRTTGAPGTVIAQGAAFRGSTFTPLVSTGTTNVTTTGALTPDVTADFTPTDDTINITNAFVILLN